MWGLVYNSLCSFAFTIKCLSSYIKTLILSMMPRVGTTSYTVTGIALSLQDQTSGRLG